MSLQEFKDWALAQGQVGKATDGQFVGECVSLINQYLSKVFGISAGAWGDAKDWATNGNVLSYFNKVSSPQAGDIGVSGAVPGNPYGHIWIYLSPTTILEQNGRVSRRVSTGSTYLPPIAILRRNGTPQEGAEDMQIAASEVAVDRPVVIREYENALDRDPKPEEINQWAGTSVSGLQLAIQNSPEFAERRNRVKTLEKTNTDLQNENTALKAQLGTGDAEANSLGKALIALISKFGYKKG